MIGLIGEDDSEVETLKVLVRRLRKNPKLSVKTKGYGGCGDLLTKGAKMLVSMSNSGCTKFVVCYDSDGN